MTGREVRVGSRGSPLALIQAEFVVARLKELYPQTDFTIEKVVTRGDQNRHTPLDRQGSIGVFVKELEEALLDKRVDLAVHSLKDVPTIISDGLCLAAVTERLDPRDVLITRGELLEELSPGSRIGTSSLRRAAQVAQYRKDLQVQSIRGNIDTRLRKVYRGEVDAVITAAAAMIRLGRQESITQYLPLDYFLPSIGQGTLAIETRQGDDAMLEMASGINHVPTWQSITAERSFLAALGGGCSAPIAALASMDGGRLGMAGMAASTDGTHALSGTAEGDASLAVQVGEALAKKLLRMGASQFLERAMRK